MLTNRMPSFFIACWLPHSPPPLNHPQHTDFKEHNTHNTCHYSTKESANAQRSIICSCVQGDKEITTLQKVLYMHGLLSALRYSSIGLQDP